MLILTDKVKSPHK